MIINKVKSSKIWIKKEKYYWKYLCYLCFRHDISIGVINLKMDAYNCNYLWDGIVCACGKVYCRDDVILLMSENKGSNIEEIMDLLMRSTFLANVSESLIEHCANCRFE